MPIFKNLAVVGLAASKSRCLIVGLVEIRFLLSPIIFVASENSSGITIANGVDGNCQEGSHWSSSQETVVEPVLCIHLLCTRRLCVGLVENEFILMAIVSVTSESSSGIAIAMV